MNSKLKLFEKQKEEDGKEKTKKATKASDIEINDENCDLSKNRMVSKRIKKKKEEEEEEGRTIGQI